MKTFLLLATSLSIALTQIVQAEEQQDKVKAPKNHAKATQASRPVVTPPSARVNQRAVQANQYHPKVQSTARVHTNPMMPRANGPRSTTVQANTAAHEKNWQHQQNTQNTIVQSRDRQNQHNQNVTGQRNSYQRLNNNSWEEARRRHRHGHHDRNWWRHHYTRFALFGAGYFFWDAGYWYPAYGYDPAYNTYDYNEPIYGYNDMEPAQVIANVQTELQRRGYYRAAVDGRIGPMTRAALSNYQRDTGLSITSAIDRPTLQSLGLR